MFKVIASNTANCNRGETNMGHRQNSRQLANTFVAALTLAMMGTESFAAINKLPSLKYTGALRSLASSTADYELVTQLLNQLPLVAPQQQSAIITQLATYKYVEVVDALIKAIDIQLQSGNTNTFIVSAAIDSLASMADKSRGRELEQLSQKMSQVRHSDQKLSNEKTYSTLDHKLKTMIAQANSRYQTLARLATMAPPVSYVTADSKVRSASGSTAKASVTLQDRIMELLRDSNLEGVNEIKSFLAVKPDYLTDEAIVERRNNSSYQVIGREQESNDVIDTLVRTKGKNPILVGPRGTGKTSIASKIAEIILDEAFPQNEAYMRELKGAQMISITPGKISLLAKSDADSSQGAAMEQFLDSVLWLEQKLNTKLILFIDEIHTLSKGQIEAMKPYLDSKRKAIRLIGASTSVEMQNAFKNNPAFLRRLQQIGVAEQSLAEITKIVESAKLPSIKKNYNVSVTPEALEVMIKNSKSIYPDKSQVDAAVTFTEDLAIAQIRLNPAHKTEGYVITEDLVYNFIQKRTKFPVNPLDATALTEYGKNLETQLEKKVVGQTRMIKDLTAEWITLLRSHEHRGLRSIALLGKTGTGKSLLGREFAKQTFGSESAFLEIDANNYKNGGLDLNSLFGAPNGVSSSSETAGQLYDFMDDPGRGKFGGVILINEGERAHPDFWERWMEIMDTGRGTGGDGKERPFSKHILILTSNRGDKIVFPQQSEEWSEKEIAEQMARYDSEELKKLFTQKTSGKDTFTLPDPVLARIDMFSLAAPVTKHLALKVSRQKVQELTEQLQAKYKIKITVDQNVAASIALTSYSPGMGVRPIEKAVERLIGRTVISALASTGITKNETLHLDVVSDNSLLSLRGAANNKAVLETLPRIKPTDKMDDPEFIARLNNLNPSLNKKVIGQEEALEKISDAVLAHEGNSANATRPQSFFLVGSTGIGKTEVAKALAEALYDKAERVAIIPLGHVRFDGHLNQIFGSTRGFTGSTEISAFEQALIDNPQGGVIVFDEASNMGGNDIDKKNELFKTFYNILDEGKWTSEATHKTYFLKDYKIIFTGNDGEKLTMGLSADDMKLSEWKKNKSPEQVRELLAKAGVPQAFLGRMSEIILYKPLVKADIKKITDKLINQALANHAKDGLMIEFSPDFYEKVSDAFFSSDIGARSIRNVAEKQISSLVSKAIVLSGGRSKLAGHTLRFSIMDNRNDKPYATDQSPEREVQINMEVIDQNKQAKLRLFLPATEYATKELKLSPKNALATSYHEAGHAVVNDPRITGQKISYITIRGGRLSDGTEYLGYARYEDAKSGVYSARPNENLLIQRAAQLLAGQWAQQLAGYGADAGWSDDLAKTRNMISESLLKWGLVRELQAVRVSKSGEPILSAKQSRALDENMERIFLAAENLAKETLTQKWNLVRALVGELVAKGSVDEARFKSIQNNYDNSRQNRLDAEKMRILSINAGNTGSEKSNKRLCSAVFR